MKPLTQSYVPYRWAPSTEEIAVLAGIDPVEVLRFDGNVPPVPPASARPGAIAARLARVNEYPHGGYGRLVPEIARYAGVEPENVVLGAGADDLILLVARAYAGPGDTVAIPEGPTYPLFRIAAQLTGAEVCNSLLQSPVLTYACRPNNPTGALDPLPDARPLVVDEAYFEFSGETAVGLIDHGVIVLRTFSKRFGLAGARVGYALADAETARELNARQDPAPISTLSAELALAVLASPPPVEPVLEERERLAAALRGLGLEPAPSHANFLWVPLAAGAEQVGEALLRRGLAVRTYAEGLRISVRDRADDDTLVEGLARVLERDTQPPAPARRARHVRATAETRQRVRLDLDGEGRVVVLTGGGLYDHLWEQLAFHAGFDLQLEAVGDLETGEHHSVEDAALALGEALDRALGDRRGLARYGDAVVPMDDALARAAVDLGGRPWAELDLERDPGLAGHALTSLAQAARAAIHVEARGQDEHHVAEAAFKAVGRALRAATRRDGDLLPSTKGRM